MDINTHFSFLGIRVIDTRHEVNAVFAADAVARVTNKPGNLQCLSCQYE